MEKKHAKHRAIPSKIISHPVYKGMKAKSKTPHRYDMWEDSVIGGLHIFEWLVIGVSALLLVGIWHFGMESFAKIGQTVGCPSCGGNTTSIQ